MNKCCETCFNHLGGIYDCCRLNLEKECREDAYQAWEPKHRKGETHDEGSTKAESAVSARH